MAAAFVAIGCLIWQPRSWPSAA